MPTNNLTDAQCRNAVPGEKARKLFDGGGLFLWISAKGAKVWRLAYRDAEAKQRTISFGPYPEVSLADARRKRDEAKTSLREGVNPMDARHLQRKRTMTLAQAIEKYWDGRTDISEKYRHNAKVGLRTHLGPVLGKRDVVSIKRADILTELMRVDAAGRLVYVRKIRNWLAQVFSWLVEQGVVEENPVLSIDPKRAFRQPVVQHQSALGISDIHGFMDELDFQGDLLSALACKMLALTWVRTNELRFATWKEFDGDVWRIPAARMKMRRDHVIPLSRQAMDVLELLRVRSRGSDFVVASEGSVKRPISENAVLYLLYRMGYQGRMTGHGWRAVGSTWANERGYAPEVIDRQLSHVQKSQVRAAYNRAEYLQQRREMMQAWADWLLP